MCTGFVKKGNDLLFGFNLDLALGIYDYKVYPKDDMFYVGIKIGSTIYKTHGVNSKGHFGNLPYMNGDISATRLGGKMYQRIDLLVNKYISGLIDYNDLLDIVKNKTIVNIPNASMHSLFSNSAGDTLLVEPMLGYKECKDDFAVVSNFPLLKEVNDDQPWYGKDRYKKAYDILSKSGDSFNYQDGLKLLKDVHQDGEWATRVSFVYSKNENAVYYVLNNDFDNVKKHQFK